MADTNKVVQLSAFDMGNPTSTLEVVNTPRPSPGPVSRRRPPAAGRRCCRPLQSHLTSRDVLTSLTASLDGTWHHTP
jgi:hypothetical protein